MNLNANQKFKWDYLQLNESKTKAMTNEDDPQNVTIGNKTMEYVEEYLYLGQIIKCGKSNQTAEVERRIRLAWAPSGIT